MKVKIREDLGNSKDKIQNSEKKQDKTKSITLDVKNFDTNHFDELMELREIVRIRNSDKGYSKGNIFDRQQELKVQSRLKSEFVTLNNSPVEYLQNRFDYLEQTKYLQLESELFLKRITKVEFDHKLSLLLAEMDLIESIITRRTNYSKLAKSAFPLIGTVFQKNLNEENCNFDPILKYRNLFEILYQRQRQINMYNSLQEFTESSKPNGDKN
jgi:hypothetical protein